MTGLFIFADQLMMVKFIPAHFTPEKLWGNDLLTQYNKIRLNIDFASADLLAPDISELVRTSVAYCAPVTIIINATALLVGNGTAVNYNRYNGQKNFAMARKTWITGFWCNLFISLLLMVIICASCDAFIRFEQGNVITNKINELQKLGWLDQHQLDVVRDFYTKYFNTVYTFSRQFIYTIGVGCVFAIFSSFITLLVIAEAKQMTVMIFAIICNVFNVLLDFIFLRYAKMNTFAGGLATCCGWLLNLCMCFVYIWYLDKKKSTNLILSDLKKFIFNFKEYWTLCKLGLCSFLRNISIAVGTTLQVALIISVTNKGAEFQSIYGAVNPIVTLLFTAALSSTNGARTVSAYNYGAGNWQRVRSSYLCLSLIMIGWAIFVFLLCGVALNTQLLTLFSVRNLDDAKKVLMINLIVCLPVGLTVAAMMLFQSTNQWWKACINGIMYGIICYIPIIFLAEYIAKTTNNPWLFICAPIIIASIAAIICNIWSIIYLHKNCKTKKLQTNRHV